MSAPTELELNFDLRSQQMKPPSLIYWRDIFGLVTGSKVQGLDEDIKTQLLKYRSYFSQGLLIYESNKNPPSDLTFKKQGSKLVDMVYKLSYLTGLPEDKSWEIISTYLLYGFRGSPESLKEIIALTEEKNFKIFTDMYYFYYRERQFLLKTWYHILTNMEGHKYCSVYTNFVQTLNMETLYHSFLDQFIVIVHKERPNTSSFDPIHSARFTDIWLQYQISELITIAKILLICGSHYIPSIDSLTTIASVLIRIKIMHCTVLAKDKEKKHEPQYAYLIQLLVLHFIQLVDFEKIDFKAKRWSDKSKFQALSGLVNTAVNTSEDCGSIIAAWVLVNYILNMGFKKQEVHQLLEMKDKRMHCWIFFSNILDSKEMEDKAIFKLAAKAIYQVVYLTVELFSLHFSYDQNLLSLTNCLLRDDYVLNHFWVTPDNMGLKIVLSNAEQWFPVEFSPLLSVYTTIASKSLYNSQKILERLNKELDYCEYYRHNLNLKTSADLFYESSIDHHPLEFFKDIVIPAGTKCILNIEKNYLIRWKFAIPFFSIVRNTVKKWIQELYQYPKCKETAVPEIVVDYLKLINEFLKNGHTYDKTMTAAIEDIFSNLSRSCEKLDITIVQTAMVTAKYILKTYPVDVIFILEGMKVIPTFDHVIMNHVDAARGQNFHTNTVKTFLELVEIKQGHYPLLISYLEFVRELFEVQNSKVSWTSLAGVVFMLRDVLPSVMKWYFVDNDERIKLNLLLVEIIHLCLIRVKFEETPSGFILPTSAKLFNSTTDEPTVRNTPTGYLLANICLHSLLNTDAGITLLHFVAIGEQHLFGVLETYNSWNCGRSVDIIRTLYYALSNANTVLLYKTAQVPKNILTIFESQIFKEPRDSNQLHVVLNIASYIYLVFNSSIRSLSLKLLTRFANNVDLSLSVCLGMEAHIIRHLFLHPLYSDMESEQIKVAVIDFVTECIHSQHSLAEAFLNVAELRESLALPIDMAGVQTIEKGLSGGILQIVLSIVKQTTTDNGDNMTAFYINDQTYFACARLLEALWKKRTTIILIYLRRHNTFFLEFCYLLLNDKVFNREIAPLYSKVFSILSMELYCRMKSGDQLNNHLWEFLERFMISDEMFKWAKYCIDPDYKTNHVHQDKNKPHRAQLLKAWNHFLGITLKMNFTVPKLEKILAHSIKSLVRKMSSLKNSHDIQLVAELFLMVISYKNRLTANHIARNFDRISYIIEQVACNYDIIPPKAVECILTASATWLKVSTLTDFSEDQKISGNIVEVVCSILNHEIQLIIKENGNLSELIEKRIAGALYLAKSMTHIERRETIGYWKTSLKRYRIVSQIIFALSAILKKEQFCEVTLFLLELLIDVIKAHPTAIEAVDTFDLQYVIWDGLVFPGPYVPHRFSEMPYKVYLWTPIYIQGLNLVYTLYRHRSCDVRQIAHDFFYMHSDDLCEIILLPSVSIKPYAVELMCAVLRLVHVTVMDSNPWLYKHKARISRIAGCVKICANELVNLLNQPDKVIKHFEQNHSSMPKIQHFLDGLLQAYILCMNILRVLSPYYGDVISCHRMNMPIQEIMVVFPLPSLHGLIQRLAIYMNAIRFWTRIVSVNSKIFGSSSSQSIASSSSTNTMCDTEIETHFQSATDDAVQLLKIFEYNPSDLKMALQLTLHVMLPDVLVAIFFHVEQSRDKHIFIREFISELSMYSEFVRRYRYETIPSPEENTKKPSKARRCLLLTDYADTPRKTNRLKWTLSEEFFSAGSLSRSSIDLHQKSSWTKDLEKRRMIHRFATWSSIKLKKISIDTKTFKYYIFAQHMIDQVAKM